MISEHTHQSKSISDYIKGIWPHSLNVTSQWLLYFTTSDSTQFYWKIQIRVKLNGVLT